MVASRTWAVLVSVSAMFMLIGCSEDDDGGPGRSSAVTVTFENWDLTEMDYWIILSSADGRTPLAARRITENGTFQVGTVMIPGRFTFSGVWRAGSSLSVCYSYVKTSERNWLFRQTDFSSEGDANVHVTYPAGQYSSLSIQGPFGNYGSYSQSNDSSAQAHVYSIRPEAENTVSFLGVVRGELVERCGWITGLPFRPGINSYELALDQPLTTHVITTTRPLSSLSLDGVRSANDASYHLGDTSITGGSQSFSLRVPEFPVTAYWLYGNLSDPLSIYSRWQKAKGGVPAALTVSDATVNATIDMQNRAFRDVEVQGEADAVWGFWGSNGTDPDFVRIVTVPSGENVMALPALPDSIFALLGVDPQSVQPQEIGMMDYDPAESYDEYMAVQSQIVTPYVLSQYDGLYEYVRNIGGGAVDTREHARNKWMPKGMDMGWWMLGMPGRSEWKER